jgi:hydrogenase 3 maturation protease
MTCGGEAKQLLRDWLSEPTLALAIGHPLHGDDALGPLVCAQAEGRAVDCGDAPERYLGLAGDPEVARVLLIDAVDFGGAPGEIAFCTLDDLTERAGTTHTTGLAVLVRYLQETYAKPVAVLGVQPAETRFGAGVSEAVKAAAAEVSAVLASSSQVRNLRHGSEREAVWTRS